MTDRKTFKKHVRARMARTGESYTTARRHVLSAGAPPRSPFVVPGYPATGGGTHHASALLHRVLAQAGIDHSEALLAGLGGGIGFLYAIFEYPSVTTMTIVTQHHPDPFIPAALTRAGIPYEVRTTGSANVAERRLRTVLDAGTPAVCLVDRNLLPWHPGVPFGDPYPVAVIGLDGDTVLVDDQCTTPSELPLADFLAAWGRPRKSRHHLLTITGKPGREPDVADAVATTRAHLTGPVLGNSFDVNFGLSGMRRLVAQLGDLTSRKGWHARFPTPEALHSALARLHVCLEIEYGSPGATRPIYADFLDEVGRPEAASVYREAGEAWSLLARRALASPALNRFGELVEVFMTAQAWGGSPADLAEVVQAAYTIEPGEIDRATLLPELSGLAEAAVALEERALAHMNP